MFAKDEHKIFNFRVAAFAAVTVLTVWAIVHSARTRTWEDFLHYSVYIGVPIMILVWIGLLVEHFDKSESARKLNDPFGTAVLAAPISSLVLGMLYYWT